jgi:hypothetical protein
MPNVQEVFILAPLVKSEHLPEELPARFESAFLFVIYPLLIFLARGSRSVCRCYPYPIGDSVVGEAISRAICAIYDRVSMPTHGAATLRKFLYV